MINHGTIHPPVFFQYNSGMCNKETCSHPCKCPYRRDGSWLWFYFQNIQIKTERSLCILQTLFLKGWTLHMQQNILKKPTANGRKRKGGKKVVANRQNPA